MTINLRSEGAKRRELATQLRISLTMERTLKQRVRKEIRRVGMVAATNYRHSGSVSLDPQHIGNLAKVLHAHYLVTAKLFGRRVLKSIRKKEKSSDDITLWGFGPEEIKATEAQFLAAVLKFAEKQTASRVKHISNTTREQIKGVVARGISEGLGIPDIASMIEDSTSSISLSRAETIARTETHMASQQGSMLAAESLEVPMLKEWVSAEDERTRPTHSDANGRQAKQGEPFRIGDSNLDFPGDPNGAPEEVINCRCVVTFIVDETELDRQLGLNTEP